MIESIIKELLTAESTADDVKRVVKENSFPLIRDAIVTFLYIGSADAVNLRHWIYGLPSSIPLHRLGQSDLWYRSMEFPLGSRIEYKFGVIKGGHEEWILDPLNQSIAHDPFGGNSVVQSKGYVAPDWAEELEGVSKGHFVDVPITSKSFGDTRVIKVYVPPKFRDYRRYRLLIVHDGDDYIRYSKLNHVLDNLIHRLEIPPLIVALSNPMNRLREYADDKRHADHIVGEVIPKLGSRFPLIDQSSGRSIMGASFGGVASMSTAWHYPQAFGSMFVQSGSFAFTDIGDHSRSPAFDPVVKFMNEFRRNPGKPVDKAYVTCGVYESLIYENRSMVPFLQHRGIEVRFKESFDGHNWENWRDRLRDGLTWLFPGPLWVTYN